MSETNIDKSSKVTASVRIKDKPVSFVSLSLNQAYYEHHSFTIVLDNTELEKKFMESPENTLSFLGEKIVMDITHDEQPEKAYTFVGIITDVAMEGMENPNGGHDRENLILSGYSPSILLERGEKLNAFSETDIDAIVSELSKDIINTNLSIKSEPAFKNNSVEFMMQYYESDFEMLRRLAIQYGETMYFSGSELIVGNPKNEWDVVSLVYNKDISSMRLVSQILPYKAEFHHYLRDKDEDLKADTLGEPKDASGFVKKSIERTDAKLLGKHPLLPSEVQIASKEALQFVADAQKGRTAAGMIRLSCRTITTCHARIGRTIEMKLPASMGVPTDVGRFIVVKTAYNFYENGQYACDFEAVPAGLGHIPAPELPMPMASTVRAKVISNKDEKGRVQVLFDFPTAKSSCWLYVMSPNAGSETNRGMVFIPEEGDQVLVDFENGNPNLPYVMGSFFNGSNLKTPGDNSIKSIITRSGHTIELNDNDKGEWGITIKDKNGNKIHLNSKNKTIEISADEEIRFKSKNIYMLASEKLSLFGNNEIVMHSDDNIDIESFRDINIIGKENNIKGKEILDLSGNSLNIGAESDLLMYGQNTRLNGESNMNINAPAINMASGTDSFPFKDRVIEKEIVMILKK